jgi:ATP-dependent DNA helicase UvrD/PcrA
LISTIEFQQVTPPSSTHRRTPHSVIPPSELADELGQNLVNVDPDLSNGESTILVSTLHSHALLLLRRHPAARAARSLRFLLDFERDAMLYDVGVTYPLLPKQLDRQRELKRVCAEWAYGADLEIAGFVGELDRWLRFHNAMLIDEVVTFARRGLESGAIPSGQFDHVVIDEYQDLTAGEQRMVELIWSRRGSLVVLGDDDQSIYSFRFNHPGGITEFADHCPPEELDDIDIPENRRCGRSIVALANAMMAEAGSHKPPMVPKRDEEGELNLVYWRTLEEEIAGLARYMQERKDTRFLVLVPRRFVGYRVKDAIGDAALTSFHEEVLETPLVQQRFALAGLLANGNDRVALRALLSFDATGTGYGTKRNAEAYSSIGRSELNGIALLEAIATSQIQPHGAGSRDLVARAKDVCAFLADQSGSLGDRVNAIFDPSLASAIEDEEDREKARGDLEQLRNAALATLKNNQDDLPAALDQLRYRIAMRIALGEAAEARIRIMTHHGAKGLEADVVIIAGAADQIIPGTTPLNPALAQSHREEQRRLLYVSVTRAKRELVISWPLSMDYKDATKNQVRIDRGAVWRRQSRKLVKLARTSLLPEVQPSRTGVNWLKAKLS